VDIIYLFQCTFKFARIYNKVLNSFARYYTNNLIYISQYLYLNYIKMLVFYFLILTEIFLELINKLLNILE